VKSDQIDIFAATVFCDFEQVEHTQKSGLTGQLWSDVGKADRFDGVDFNRSFFHAIALADRDARAEPETHGAGDFAAEDAFAKAFGEDHEGYGSTGRRARCIVPLLQIKAINQELAPSLRHAASKV
jgi:phosphopantetheinyl transferase (holo-ACP synthase)